MENPKKGRWVRVDGRLGILNDFDAANGEVHFVNNRRETVEVTNFPLVSIKDALIRTDEDAQAAWKAVAD